MPSSAESSREQRINQAIAEYLQAAQSGIAPQRDEWLVRHPDIAKELAEFLEDQQLFQQAAAPLKGPSGGSSRADDPTMPMTATPALGTGTRIRYFGRYELIDEIARGGMGVVYKARQLNLKRIVALKMILAGQLATPQDVERFRAEAEAAAKLNHPNIVPIYEVGEHEGYHYFSMALVEGVSLARKLTEGIFESRAAAELIKTVAEAIHYAHIEGVIHRDLKPGNILLDRNDSPHVTDFGLAKRVEGEAQGLTATGQTLGTPSYMPPEQAHGDSAKVGPAADVYSLGAVLYCLVTGRPPFQTANPVETLLQVLTKEPVSPRQLNSAVPRDLETIILKCLEKDATQRYQSAGELRDELERFVKGEPILARPLNAPTRAWRWCRRNKSLALTGGIAVLAMVLFTLASLFAAQREKENALRLAGEQAKTLDALDNVVRERDKAVTANRLAEQRKTEAEASARLTRRLLYAAHMNLARQAWESGRVDVVLNLLEQHRPSPGDEDLRGFEWYYFDRVCHADLRTLVGHEHGIARVLFSPDGCRIASCDLKGTIKLWNVVTGKEEHTLRGHQGGIMSMAFSPDGSRLATGSLDRTARVWNVVSGQAEQTLQGHHGWVYHVAFNSQGTRIATAGGDRNVKVWVVDSGKEQCNLEGHTGDVLSVAFSPNGMQLASASQDKSVRLWDLTTAQTTKILTGHEGFVNSVAFHPNGTLLATASRDGTVKIWDAKSGTMQSSLKGHSAWVIKAEFNHDGTCIASTGMDHSVKVWELATGMEMISCQGLGVPCFSPDGTLIAIAKDNGMVKIIDVATGKETNVFKGHTAGANCVAFSPDGRTLATGSMDQTVRLWDAKMLPEVLTLKGHTDYIFSLVFNRDGTRLATGSRDNSVKIWNAASGEEVQTLKGHTNQVTCSNFTDDGTQIATASWDGKVKLWSTVTGNEIRQITNIRPIKQWGQVLLNHDGTRVAVTDYQYYSIMWNVATGQELLALKDYRTIAISPDGKQLVATNLSPTAKLWDVATGKELMELTGHTDAILNADFSPDGKSIATTSKDGTLKLWLANSGQAMLTLPAGGTPAFSPDGKRIAAISSKDKTIKVWDVATGKEEVAINVKGNLAPTFSPDGRRIATISFGETVKLWDAETGQETFALDEHTGIIERIVFSRDGTRIATASRDKTVKIWYAPIPNLGSD